CCCGGGPWWVYMAGCGVDEGDEWRRVDGDGSGGVDGGSSGGCGGDFGGGGGAWGRVMVAVAAAVVVTLGVVAARGGEWYGGSNRSGDGDRFWVRRKRLPEKFSGDGGGGGRRQLESKEPEMLLTSPLTAVSITGSQLTPNFRHPNTFFNPWNAITRKNRLTKNRIRASARELSGPVLQPKPRLYHPSEDISDCEESDENGYAILRPAETSRTIIEANSKGLLMFSGLVSDGVYENIFLPDLPYVKGENGDIYFQVKNNEDVLETLASGDNIVQVIIGLDTSEMVSEMESLAHLDDDSGFEDEDSDIDDDDDEDEDDDENGNYVKDWVSVLEDDEDSDGSVGDWAKLDTMRSTHPIDFANHLADFVSDVPIDYMDRPPSGLAIHGLLRPAYVDENAVLNGDEVNQIAEGIEGIGLSQDVHNLEDELQKDQSSGNGNTYYKLEMIKMQLISAHGNQVSVEVEDFSRSQPDAIAHTAAKIISRVKSGGDTVTQALKSLCWRYKGIQVEEVALIGVDSLGFDLRACSGRQVETLRFAFKNRASSEFGVESQLNCLLFPIGLGQQQKKDVVHQSELS
nr:hypothetical protein [Tanacetum cinerariifolium]